MLVSCKIICFSLNVNKMKRSVLPGNVLPYNDYRFQNSLVGFFIFAFQDEMSPHVSPHFKSCTYNMWYVLHSFIKVPYCPKADSQPRSLYPKISPISFRVFYLFKVHCGVEMPSSISTNRIFLGVFYGLFIGSVS